MRSLTLRLDDDLWEEIEVVARLSGRSATDLVREAVGELIDAERRAPEFRAALQQLTRRTRSRLSRFGQV